MTGPTLVDNFGKLRKAVKELDTDLDGELRQGLKAIGVKVSTKAKDQAESNGLHATGALVRQIAPSVRTKDVAIQAKAQRKSGKNAPYRYPGVYEYGGAELRGTHGQFRAVRNRSEQGARLKAFSSSIVPGYGPRAFLAPAVVKSEDLIKDELFEVLDDVARKAGFH